MNEFDNLASIWKQQAVQKEPREFQKARSIRLLLKKRAFWSCIGLVSLTLWIGWIGLFSSKDQLTGLTFASNLLIMLVLMLQAGFSAFSYIQLNQLHQDGNPDDHLKKWNAYYQHRISFLRNIGPLFFILLNGAFLLYLPEVLDSYPNTYYQVGFILFYVLCMVVAWYGPAKFYLKKELDNLKEVSQILNSIGQQWNTLEEETTPSGDRSNE